MNTENIDVKVSDTEETVSNTTGANVGAGPVKAVSDGGTEGEQKQPKERTGNLTGMGGATGGTAGMPNGSEGGDANIESTP